MLGAEGYPDVPFLNVSVERHPEQEDWVVLSCDGSTSREASPAEARANRRAWADFLREQAELTVAGFGYQVLSQRLSCQLRLPEPLPTLYAGHVLQVKRSPYRMASGYGRSIP